MTSIVYDLVIYQHFPKCGGRSLIDAIHKNFHRKSDTPPSYSTKEQRAEFIKNRPDTALFQAPTLLHGHLIHDGFRPIDRYPDLLKSDRTALFTVIRNPLERAISAYYHRRKKGRETGETLEVWLNRRKNNICHGLSIEFSWGQPGNDPFLMIGLTERLQDSVKILSALCGFPEEQMQHLNKSTRDPYELDPKFLKAFQKANASDYALFEYANRRMDAALKAINSGKVEEWRSDFLKRKRKAFGF